MSTRKKKILERLFKQIERHPNFNQVGMIDTHTGVVRGVSRDKQKVQGLIVRFDYTALDNLLDEMRQRPGIIEIFAEITEGTLKVGDHIMTVVVAGDIREHVFPILTEAVNRIKQSIIKKEEEF